MYTNVSSKGSRSFARLRAPARGSECGQNERSRAAARARLLVSLAIFALLGLPAQAQNATPADESEEPGLPLGPFRFFPTVIFENVYDDNVFAQERSKDDDYLATFIPGVAVESTWSKHFLSVSAYGQIHRYADNTNEDHEEYAVETRGRLDLLDESAFGATFGQGRKTLARTDAENTGRVNPEQYDYFEGEISYDHEFARFDLGVLGFADHLDYLDSEDSDRDRVEFGGSTRLAFRVSPAFSIFLEPGVEVRDYEESVDDDGVKRSSVTVGGFVGSEFDITSVIDGEISVGVVHADFDEPSFDDLTTVGVRGAATWEVTPLTRLEAEVERSVRPTAVDGASSRIRTLASIEGRHELLRNVILRADATYYREKFQELGRTDHNYRVRIGAEYLINRFFSIGARYSYRERDSNFNTRDYRRNRIMLTLEVRL